MRIDDLKSLLSELHDSAPDLPELLEHLHHFLDSPPSNPENLHTFLECGHFPAVNRQLYRHQDQAEWLEGLRALIQRSHFHTGRLLEQRVGRYGDKPLFQTIHGKEITTYSYQNIWLRIHHLYGCLQAQMDLSEETVIGIFSPNSLNSALLDLTCLSFGIRTVPIPANASEAQLNFIIHHAQISRLFIGGTEQVNLLDQLSLDQPLRLILFPGTPTANHPFETWQDFYGTFDPQKTVIHSLPESPDMDGIASIMYTSGTTADPKGIIFTQTHLIFKRFARALALPEIGSEDVFLSFLPLYHTFGRFLEMMGAIFWGATYTFAEAPTFTTLLREFPLVKPTIFISIPKRWIQLYEQIKNQAPLASTKPEDVAKTVNNLTGGRLKWGLSAAGYLDPDIFQFFQQHGIHLLSGYGMTEATGGITMTPPDDYHRDSVGAPLPGIDVMLGDDQELLLRGGYVSGGYFGNPITPTHKDGWFHTGDIFEEKHGHYFIIDRKKEIYKNSRGQTISPQKIENMFQDFEAIQSVFLIGDGRDYNTVLIYPDWETCPYEKDPSASDDELLEYFSSLIQSVNSFLSPYERIVNFAVIDRDFSSEHGELTPKQTYKRKQILENFAAVIEPMYIKNYISLLWEDYEIRIPNWLLREKSAVPSDVRWDNATLDFHNSGDSLVCAWNESHIRIGDFHYTARDTLLNLEPLIKTPELWIGNQAFVDFIGDPVFRQTAYDSNAFLSLQTEKLPFGYNPEYEEIIRPFVQKARNLNPSRRSLHQAALILQYGSGFDIDIALNHLYRILNEDSGNLSEIAFRGLKRLRHYPSPLVRMKAINHILPQISGELFMELIRDAFAYAQQTGHGEQLSLNEDLLKDIHFRAILSYLEYLRLNPEEITDGKSLLMQFLLHLVTGYGIAHPSSYIWSRAELIWWQMVCPRKVLRQAAHNDIQRLTSGFRKWLGPPQQLAINPETGGEITWLDVVVFDNNVPSKVQKNLLEALSHTAMLKEAIFLFSKRRLIQLDDILHRGVWITYLGTGYGKSVYRVLVQTRDMGAYNFAININENLDTAYFEDEIGLLIMTGSSLFGPKLVEDFGGYWSEYPLFTEEYIPGETLDQYLDRKSGEIADKSRIDRWQMRWLHFIWNGLMAYIDFWRRSGYTLGFDHPSPANLIIPEYDYATGTRLISIADRKEIQFSADLFLPLFEDFICETEKKYPGLQRMADWEILFSSVVQILTVQKGLKVLKEFRKALRDNSYRQRAKALDLTPVRIQEFIDDVEENGVLTKQVVFAALRYDRWLDLNPQATKEARGSVLQELYKDYGLGTLLDDYPETRIRYFLMTCFKNANPDLKRELLALQKRLRARAITLEDLDSHLHGIQESRQLTEEEEYFLTRMLFEHLDAAQPGELISWDWGPRGRLDLVTIVEDTQGEQFRIRPPFQPKEIARLHSLLQGANLQAVFRQEHEFLLMYNMNTQLIGGVFWKQTERTVAYIERVVIMPQYQKRHLSLRLLEELFSRLRDRRFSHVSVGYFQAGLFYKLGFQIDKEFGGLVKNLVRVRNEVGLNKE